MWPFSGRHQTGWFGRLARDRRGVAALTFGISAFVVIAIAGLGTEVGAWYAAQQKGQNAADAAALAGVYALAVGGGSAGAQASALNVAAQDGFSSGVVVNTPPATGANATNSSAVEVIITQQTVPLLSGLFLARDFAITTRAVAAIQSGGSACAVALNDGAGLSMGGHSTTTANNCSLASNTAGPNSIIVSGSAAVSAYTLSAVGACSGCSGSNVSLTRPASAYQLPAANPFAAADGVTLPSSANCSNGAPMPYSASNPTVYCSLIVGSQQTLSLTPGTYFISGDISFEGGSTVQCPTCTGGAGVTIVMTDSASTLKIDGNATVTLAAPTTSDYNAAFNGLLFYQASGGTPGGVTINGGSNSTLVGGMYFPSESVSFDGNESINPSACTEIVGETLTIAGDASTTLASSGCAQSGTATAQLQVARLLE